MNTANTKPRILIIDDDDQTRSLVKLMLINSGYSTVIETDCPNKALAQITADSVDVILCDWHMPKIKGLDFLELVRDVNKNIPFLMITSENRKEKVLEALQAGVSDYIAKPFNTMEIIEKIESAMKRLEKQ